MKKTICSILVLVICIGLFAGCGSTKDPAAAPAAQPEIKKEDMGKTNTSGSSTADSIATPPPKDAEYYDDLSMYIFAKVAVIDPLNPGAGTNQSGVIANMIYNTLIYYDVDGSLVPNLATEWSTDDYQTFTFKLREGVKFHNGEPFTSDDVVFTVEAAKEVVGCHLYNTFGQVEEITANGDYEVTMKLKNPNYDFFFTVSTSTAGILNREAYESNSENPGWIGTGPFYVESMIPNDSIEYARFDDYWGEPALCKHFSMRYIAEVTAVNIMLDNDEFTFAQVDSVYIPQYLSDDRFVMNSYFMDNCAYLAFNMHKPVTGDLNFRKAVAATLDLDAILEIAQAGFGKVPDAGCLWGNKTNYKDLSIPQNEFNLDKAKEYLAQSSYNGEELEICASMSYTIKIATYLQAVLTEIGVNCKVHEFDGPSWSSATLYDTNELDIMIGSGAWNALASSCKTYLTPGSGSNKARYENQEVVELMAKADSTPDGPDREALYHQIQQIVYGDLPYVPILHGALYIAGQKGTGGVKFFPSNNHDYSHAYRLKDAD